MTSTSKIWKELTSNLSNLDNFHSLEVVDRVSVTQLQVGENSNWIIWRLKGAEILSHTSWKPKGFFMITIYVLVSAFWFIWIPMLWNHGNSTYFHSYSAGINFRVRIWRLQTSDSDVQIRSPNVCGFLSKKIKLEPKKCVKSVEMMCDIYYYPFYKCE